MTKKMLNKLVNLYDDIYSDVPYHKVKMVSFIIYKGKILCWGVNSDKTSTLQHYWRIRTRDTHEYIYDKRHSEVDCINKIPRDFTDFHKAELVIISKKADGNFRLARPCKICQTMLKNYNFKSIYYTTYENVFAKEIRI